MATTPFITTIGNHQRDNVYYYDAFHLPGNEHWYSFPLVRPASSAWKGMATLRVRHCTPKRS